MLYFTFFTVSYYIAFWTTPDSILHTYLNYSYRTCSTGIRNTLGEHVVYSEIERICRIPHGAVSIIDVSVHGMVQSCL